MWQSDLGRVLGQRLVGEDGEEFGEEVGVGDGEGDEGLDGDAADGDLGAPQLRLQTPHQPPAHPLRVLPNDTTQLGSKGQAQGGTGEGTSRNWWAASLRNLMAWCWTSQLRSSRTATRAATSSFFSLHFRNQPPLSSKKDTTTGLGDRGTRKGEEVGRGTWLRERSRLRRRRRSSKSAVASPSMMPSSPSPNPSEFRLPSPLRLPSILRSHTTPLISPPHSAPNSCNPLPPVIVSTKTQMKARQGFALAQSCNIFNTCDGDSLTKLGDRPDEPLWIT